MTDPGHVFWLFGLSGAGKTTLAGLLQDQLRRHGLSEPLMLDGDRLRSGLCSGLDYSEAGRTENLRRASEVARIAVESGIDVVASFITPRGDHRRLVQQTIGSPHISFVHVSASLDVCRARDVKGLYAKAQKGMLAHLSGLDAIFDQPVGCDLVLDTNNLPVARSSADLFSFARRRLQGAIPAADRGEP